MSNAPNVVPSGAPNARIPVDRHREVIRLFLEGRTYREVADRMGLTRNAVAYTIRRYRDPELKQAPKKVPRANAKPKALPKEEIAGFQRLDEARRIDRRLNGEFKNRDRYRTEVVGVDPSLARPLMETTECRWPMFGDIETGYALAPFCNNARAGSSSYCAHHLRISTKGS